ncbi:MOSC domain-containing protein [Chengkuizengella axinellae]|uniref:MOSC domain-containing protein n=1 Tax=Chengkuizengella axinellae TaxID=3064388 RepID=A0ABT9IXM9_9BACL|nr:MOSC domain-containing protein [Chengkuizengella sp. 2205SS18-9]MDP5274117.1 MOSC domain-containing protein [Chengkuizengella sp. 2205SS18-9]
MNYEVFSINIGKSETIEEGLDSAIKKTPVTGKVYVSSTIIQGDEQADLKYHGGPDQVLCVYTYDHYKHWENELNRKVDIPSFGENLTVKGISEEEVCIGDIFELGETRLQVSLPRQPCRVLAKNMKHDKFAKMVSESGYTGFYFRVLKEGYIEPGQPLVLIERHPQEVSISDVNKLHYTNQKDVELLKKVIGVKELKASLRESFQKRYDEILKTSN